MKNKGFTLIELIVVAVIIAIIAVAVSTAVSKMNGRDKGEAPERVEDATHQIQNNRGVSSYEESTIKELRTAMVEYQGADEARKPSLASLWISQANTLRADQLPEDLQAFRQSIVNAQ